MTLYLPQRLEQCLAQSQRLTNTVITIIIDKHFTSLSLSDLICAAGMKTASPTWDDVMTLSLPQRLEQRLAQNPRLRNTVIRLIRAQQEIPRSPILPLLRPKHVPAASLNRFNGALEKDMSDGTDPGGLCEPLRSLPPSLPSPVKFKRSGPGPPRRPQPIPARAASGHAQTPPGAARKRAPEVTSGGPGPRPPEAPFSGSFRPSAPGERVVNGGAGFPPLSRGGRARGSWRWGPGAPRFRPGVKPASARRAGGRLRRQERGKLFDSTIADEGTWTLEDRKMVRIVLTKTKRDAGNCWSSLLENEYVADPWVQDQMQKKLTLERFQNENPGFDFSGAEISGNYSKGGPDFSSLGK
uniref:CS domain-containing protein n=1 Tax=Ornithorhynchus anatinus TaxID=9258 RepID=A0A6I8PGR9_ORNAN